jgi:hypothetical protein
MDEFGHPTDQVAEEQDQYELHSNAFLTTPTPHDETSLPVRTHPPPSSPAPFSHYVATDEKVVSLVPNGKPPVDYGRQADDDKGAGCCKCVIM